MGKYLTDPVEIEKQSMQTITGILGNVTVPPLKLKVIKRVIHTTADFHYAKILRFNNDAIAKIIAAIREQRHIVTDTEMAKAGINKKKLAQYGVEVRCFMQDKDVAEAAKRNGGTRAMSCMEKAVRDEQNGVFVIGNAPTALFRLLDLMEEGKANPAAIIGVPVGFVGAAEAKELLSQKPIPSILTSGRKGGSNVAASIVNALLYLMEEEER